MTTETVQVWKDGKLVEVIEVDVPPQVPDQVSMADARIVLSLMGLIDRVDAAIASMDGEARIVAATRWEYATHIRRDSAWVTGLGAALRLTPEQIDGLFIAAGGLDN